MYEKRRLYHLAFEHGLSEKDNFTKYTAAPPHLVKRWMKHFFRPPEAIKFPKVPRLVNRFALGADPEFAFIATSGQYFHAQDIGMNTILPFGCDLAGRQVEIRAHSSRFAIEVVASLVDALRWIPQFYPVGSLKWVATPFIDGDGCGGHIHFGRKRPARHYEITLLDHTLQLLVRAGIFNEDSCIKRRINTKFGKLGDFRLQSHGYEYRSFPTWIDDPWKAYFVLVISKLMLYYGVDFDTVRGREKECLLNLLRLYRDVDDDAAIALTALYKRGFPVSNEECFRATWGVVARSNEVPLRLLRSCYFPPSLKPEEKTSIELFESLITNLPIKQRIPQATWKPFELEKNFQAVTIQPHVFEISNIAQGLISKHFKVHIKGTEVHNEISFSGHICNLDKEAIRSAFSDLSINVVFIKPNMEFLLRIGIPERMSKNRENIKQIRRILTNISLFPICKGENIAITDWTKWDSLVNRVPLEPKLYGKVIASICGTKKSEFTSISRPQLYSEEVF